MAAWKDTLNALKRAVKRRRPVRGRGRLSGQARKPVSSPVRQKLNAAVLGLVRSEPSHGLPRKCHDLLGIAARPKHGEGSRDRMDANVRARAVVPFARCSDWPVHDDETLA